MNIVVGYLYNQNGMSTWCIEAAKALKHNGHNVLLVKSNLIPLDSSTEISSFDFEFWPSSNGKSLSYKVFNKFFNLLSLMPSVFKNNNQLPNLDAAIRDKFFAPDLYLLNQSNLFNAQLKVPQFVVAWAYKPVFNNYLQKAIKIGKLNKDVWGEIKRSISWFNHDIYAYKNANATLCVTNALYLEMTSISNRAHLVYPSYFKQKDELRTIEKKTDTISLCIMCLYLDDARKGVLWMLKAIAMLRNKHHFEITLIGNASKDFKERVHALDITSHFTGFLSRSAAIKVLLQQDVLLFGSVIDDWGFVQVEAMANGIPVIAPMGNPSDEIIGRPDFLYVQNDTENFQSKIYNITNLNLTEISSWFVNRYNNLFSASSFANKIDAIVNDEILKQSQSLYIN